MFFSGGRCPVRNMMKSLRKPLSLGLLSAIAAWAVYCAREAHHADIRDTIRAVNRVYDEIAVILESELAP